MWMNVKKEVKMEENVNGNYIQMIFIFFFIFLCKFCTVILYHYVKIRKKYIHIYPFGEKKRYQSGVEQCYQQLE